MSDTSQGPGWWQASDDKWYPPDQVPGPAPAPPNWGGGAGPGQSYPPVPGYDTAPGYGQASNYGYGQAPGYGSYAPTAPSAQGMAIASMVLGILSLVLFFCWFLGLPLALVGLPLGLIARNKIAKGEVVPVGMGQATAGIACNAIALVLALGVAILIIAS